mmetsp:Transcript_1168/g.3505  ORF Transcript_1168/g.3505 Transcript_1168/m.3505 type:complete len:215 (-) Transcript_1168:167-811(-)
MHGVVKIVLRRVGPVQRPIEIDDVEIGPRVFFLGPLFDVPDRVAHGPVDNVGVPFIVRISDRRRNSEEHGLRSFGVVEDVLHERLVVVLELLRALPPVVRRVVRPESDHQYVKAVFDGSLVLVRVTVVAIDARVERTAALAVVVHDPLGGIEVHPRGPFARRRRYGIAHAGESERRGIRGPNREREDEKNRTHRVSDKTDQLLASAGRRVTAVV